MGTYSSIFIEFKKKSDSQWHLLEAAVPLSFVGHTYSGESADDNHTIGIGGVTMNRMFTLARQGDVRDLLASHDAPFNDRGFPDDLSPELKEMFDKVQQKIDSKDNDFLFGRDWRWGKSWCYLSELESFLDKSLEKCKSDILKEHSKQFSRDISDKLYAILAAVSGNMKIPTKKDDADDYNEIEEMLDYYMNEELDSIICLKQFVSGIALIHEFLTNDWCYDSSIRLVFYAS